MKEHAMIIVTNKYASQALKAAWIATPQGRMLAVADDAVVHLVLFEQTKGLDRQLVLLADEKKSSISLGSTAPLILLEKELQEYFAGTLQTFTVCVSVAGSPFQKKVWKALCAIPYGQTTSYQDLACAVDKPTACRAVARSNSVNRCAIIIPCHRVINKSGKLCGYAGGAERKQWLLNHEKQGKESA